VFHISCELTRLNITVEYSSATKVSETKIGRAGRVQSFMLILGRVGLDHCTYGSGRVGSDQTIRPTSNCDWYVNVLVTVHHCGRTVAAALTKVS